MSRIYAIFALILISSVLWLPCSFAVEKNGQAISLKIRSAYHIGFSRIVVDGPKGVIAKGHAEIKDTSLIVSFGGTDFSVVKNPSIKYKTGENLIIFPMKRYNSINSFILKSPSRFVIDMRRRKNERSKATKETKPLSVKADVPAKKDSPDIAENKQADQKEKIVQAKISTQKKPGKKVRHRKKQRLNEELLIPDRYRKAWTVLNSDKPNETINMLDADRPRDAGLAAVYHYIYGEAYSRLSDNLKAEENFRLAYIYAKDDLRELALLKRAGLYMKREFYQEAKADYLVFIDEFPDSQDMRTVHMNLAKSLEETDEYGKAVDQYRRAGDRADAMFGQANVLHKQVRLKEAARMYKKAMLSDNLYIERSEETKFLLAENFRLRGNIIEAKKILQSINDGAFMEKAGISLGLISMANMNYVEAEIKFRSASGSEDSTIKAEALYLLSLALEKKGKQKEAISSLEDVRHNYSNSPLYKDAVMELAKLYRQEGEKKKSVHLLKELVYGRRPPADAFSELEGILNDVSEENGKAGNNKEFIVLWNEVGQWLLDESREKFLLNIAEKYRHEGKIFLDISSWVAVNGSRKGKARAALGLAEYFANMGNVKISRNYLSMVEGHEEMKDSILKVEARNHHTSGEDQEAVKKITSVKDFDDNDLSLLARIIYRIKNINSPELMRAITFYENAVNSSDREAEQYVSLADILFEQRKYEKALKYYRIAHRKKPDIEWAVYRIGRGTGRPESAKMFAKLESGDTLVSRVAKAKLMEFNLLDKVKEVY